MLYTAEELKATLQTLQDNP